ncbi:MAG: helix-turn-helix transcriptional regulator [Oscillospiraceae bacterium]|nr:helix-turn-helix transcriptional regulator [Oscillospiraceae bacterium]
MSLNIAGFLGFGLFLAVAVIVAIIVITIVVSHKSGTSQDSQQAQQIPQPVEEAHADASSGEIQPKAVLTLGEVIKQHRIRCGMTQEFVAESLDVTRQAVSKWETDSSEPSTSNLLALAKLFGISAAELLDGIE